MSFDELDCGLGPDFTRRRNAAIAALIPSLAHNFNNGLSTVVGLGDLVRIRPESPAVARLAATVDGQVRDVVSLIRILAHFSKQTLGPAEKIDAVFALRDAQVLLAPLASASRLTLEVDLPNVLPTEAISRALLQLAVVRGVEAALSPDVDLYRISGRRSSTGFDLELNGAPEPGLERGPWEAAGLVLPDPASAGPGPGSLIVSLSALDGGAPESEPERASSGASASSAILVFERDAQLAELISTVLLEGGFQVVSTTDLPMARSAARERQFDLLMADEGRDSRSRTETQLLVDEVCTQGGAAIGYLGDEIAGGPDGFNDRLQRPFRPAQLLAFAADRLGVS